MPNLCEAINALVEERLHEALETGEIINVPDMVSEMAESLAARIISSAPPEERSRLVAHLLTRLHYFLLEKREVSGVGSHSTVVVTIRRAQQRLGVPIRGVKP